MVIGANVTCSSDWSGFNLVGEKGFRSEGRALQRPEFQDLHFFFEDEVDSVLFELHVHGTA